MAPSKTPAPYPWPVKPFDHQHPVRGFLCDPRIAAGGRTFHFGVDVAAPGGTPVYAVAAGKVSFGSPAEVAQNGVIVVVEAGGRNFGYWHVAPVTPARIRWRLMRAAQPVVPWQVAFDHSTSFHPNVHGSPASDVNFGAVYAPDTRQNNPNLPGLFHFWLQRGFDTSRYPDG